MQPSTSKSPSSSLAKFFFPPDFSFYELFLVCLYVAHALFSSFHKYRTYINYLYYTPMDSTGASYLAVHILFNALFDYIGFCVIPNLATCSHFRQFMQINMMLGIGTLWIVYGSCFLCVGSFRALRGSHSM